MGRFSINYLRRNRNTDISERSYIRDFIKRYSYDDSDKDHNSNNIFIHIDEPEPFIITIQNLDSVRILSKTAHSICFHITYTNNSDDKVIIVKWSQIIADITSIDHLAVLIARDIVNVPKYEFKQTYKHHNKYVHVAVRTYIKGVTLKSVYNSLSDDAIDAIFMQLQAIMWLLAKKTSKYFGHIQNTSFKTQYPIAHLRFNAFIDKANRIINELDFDKHDWNEIGSDSYASMATFCHGNLSPDHIIIDGSNTITGIVGWSRADFMSEIYERVSYYFRSDPGNSRCWFRKLADVTITPETGRPSVEYVLNVVNYMYIRTWNLSNNDRRQIVDRLLKSLTTNYSQLNCLSLATEIERDNMSLSSLSTWEKYSVSTVKP